jgi:two-component system NarL family sensor kinase
MSRIDDRRTSSAGWHIPETVPHGFWYASKQSLYGLAALAAITFVTAGMHVQRLTTRGVGPGTISLLYLIVVVFVSRRAGLIPALLVSLIGSLGLNYFVLPLVPALEAKNPLDLVAAAVFLITAWVISGIVAELREKHALLDVLFEHAPQAIALVDADIRVIRVNGEFTRLFGYTAQETLGRPFSELIVPGELRDRFKRYTEMALQGQRVDAEDVRQRKDGSRLYVHLVSVPVCMPNGRTAIYAMYRDITERKDAEEALHALSGRLLRLEDQERRRLARELHDTTAQLVAALTMNLSVVSESADVLSPRARAAMAEAVTLADQCLRELRTVSYLLHPHELDEVGLAYALSRYVDGFTERSGIRVDVEVPPDLGRLPQEVETTVFRLVQECLTNIHRHSGSSTARLRLTRGPSDLVLEVEDTGHGIPGDARSGVGIASMRERVQQLNGQLEIASHPGGTTIKATIPLSKVAA